MPKVAKEHGEARRRQIVDAAYRCFARNGLHQTTMRDIYQEASLSPGAVYHYFDSKDDIIEASFELDYQRSLDLFATATEGGDPLEALDGLIDFFYLGLERAAALGAGRVNVQGWGAALTSPRLLETIRRVTDHYVESLSPLIRRAQKAGQIDPSLDVRSVGQLLLSLYYGLELQKALNPNLDVSRYTAAAKSILRGAAGRGRSTRAAG
jgi:AcrR family transcriptional regulator